ncbi:hypothetical protein [Pedobacter sp. Leaf176]|uniref:hypothetical protein n=1 Tax=Pedobacter sp. Leaf176 TaxID=1736286 RepID=UPI000701D3A5|nr:hypothetical protein [Pedobacter sp. Leaf176]KQR67533.1 hypothetical protein ASF92_17770 [Pedobacter sp. Leaf176]
MESISLNNNFKLSFEKLPHTIRLIVSKNNNDWVCRKEKLINLLAFAEVNKDGLFKGRLQLLKSDDRIDVQVKSELIGSVSNEAFRKVLSELKRSKPLIR